MAGLFVSGRADGALRIAALDDGRPRALYRQRPMVRRLPVLASVPLLIIPFLLYNLGLAAGPAEAPPWATILFSVPMMSGGVWAMTLGDALVVLTLVLLFVEILKSTRTSNASVVDHLLSTFVFVAYLVEFLLVQGAATSLFFTLMVITLVDVLAGFSVSLRSAGRDFNVE